MFIGNISTIGGQYIDCSKEEINELIDYYNDNCVRLVKPSRRYKMTRSDNWCAMFTSVMAHKAGYRMDNFPYEVSVQQQVNLSKQRGTFSTGVKYVDDLVVYDWSGNGVAEHVGIITKIEGDVISVLEGNYKGGVGIREVKIPNKQVLGYILI